MGEQFLIARCPEHGLHGERTECFVCAGPVEQIEVVPKERLDDLRDRIAGACDEIVAHFGIGVESDFILSRLLPLAERGAALSALASGHPGQLIATDDPDQGDE